MSFSPCVGFADSQTFCLQSVEIKRKCMYGFKIACALL